MKKLADAREPHRCLLLLDNVDRPGLLDPAQVARLNGGDWLHVLATTRLGENELHGAHRDRSFLAIDELPPDDALALIESYQPGGRFRGEAERDAAREIVRLLGCFTLAVESAAVYLGQFANDVTCAAFLARLKKEGLEGLETAASQSSEGVLHGEKRLSATLQPTLERLGAPEQLALKFAALLPPDQVPLPWLRALVAKTFPEMERDAEPGYRDPWKNVVRRLLSLRLLQATDDVDDDGQPRVVRVHRLLQQLMLHDCPATKRAELQETVDELIHKRDTALQQTTRWDKAPWELGPLTALAWLWDESNQWKAAWLLNQVGLCWYRLAEWSQAESLIRRALAIEERYGPEHSNVAVRLNNLASLLKTTNRVVEAEPLIRRALAIAEQSFGPDNPGVARSLINLANLLHATNRNAEAEPLYRRALAIDEANYGKDHSNVGNVLNDLAGFLHATNRQAEAEGLLRRALAIDEQRFGEHHPNVASILDNLASVLRASNRLAEAEPLIRRALAIDEQSLGPEHPTVGTRINNLAQLLEIGNEVAEAEQLYRRALVVAEKSFGPDHPEVAGRLNNLAHLLHTDGRLEEVEQLHRRALIIDEQSHGPHHPNVARDLNGLARLLHDTNRLAEAEPLMRRVIAILSASLGESHPKFGMSLNNLAGLLEATSRLVEAESLYRRALSIAEQSFGPDHPDVATDLNNLAGLLKETNRPAEAEPLYRRALAIWARSLGETHPNFAASLVGLAVLLEDTNRPREAEQLYRRALTIAEQSSGADHPDAARALNNLAGLLQDTDRPADAEPLYRRALAIGARSLGEDHPKFAPSLIGFAKLLRTINRPAEAEPLTRRVIAILEKNDGANHPGVVANRSNLVLTLIMLGKLKEARQILAVNWRLNAPPHANTTPRIAFLRHLIALLESQPDTPFLGQLKTLLHGAELPVASDVAVPWDIAYFIEFLKPKLGEHPAEFLTALVAALNDRSNLPKLDDLWNAQALIPLDIPWPEN